MNKKASLELETIAKVGIILAVIAVVLGIFVFQTRKGSDKFNDIGSSAEKESNDVMCMGEGISCKVSCGEGKTEYSNKKCLMPGMKCCQN